METVGPLSCGFIYVGLPERSRTYYQASNISAYISFSHSNSTAISWVPLPSLPLPPSLFLLLYFQFLLRVSASTATWAWSLGAVLGACVFPILSHGAGVASYQVPIPPFSHCSQTAPRFPLGNYTPTLYLLCGLGCVYPVPWQLWALIS